MGAKVKFSDGWEWEIVTKEEAVAIMQNGLAEIYEINLHEESESLVDSMKALHEVASYYTLAIEGDNSNWVGLDGEQS